MMSRTANMILLGMITATLAGCTCPAHRTVASGEHSQAVKEANGSDISMNRNAPVDVLTKEHRATEIVLKAAQNEAQRIRATGEVNNGKVEKIVKFARNFTDRCHHAKEERYLFPALTAAGEYKDTIAVVKAEHKLGRDLVNTIETLNAKENAIPGDQRQQIAQYLTDFADLMRKHIEKEDEILWPAARKTLTREQLDKIGMGFYTVEYVELGEDFHHKYHQLAMDLKSDAS